MKQVPILKHLGRFGINILAPAVALFFNEHEQVHA
jgi:hypothetical protein